MTVKGGNLGPEYGIGHPLGNAIEAPVMILKCCIGNRALGWDLLPPGSEGFEFTDSAGSTGYIPATRAHPSDGRRAKNLSRLVGMPASNTTMTRRMQSELWLILGSTIQVLRSTK